MDVFRYNDLNKKDEGYFGLSVHDPFIVHAILYHLIEMASLFLLFDISSTGIWKINQ